MLAASFLPLLLFAGFAGLAFMDDGESGGETDPDRNSDLEDLLPEGGEMIIPVGDDDDPVDLPDIPDTTGLGATIATDGGAPEALEPSADGFGLLSLFGTDGDDEITTNPDAATPVEIVGGEGEDTVSAGIFHSFDMTDGEADEVTVEITEPALEIAATDEVDVTEDGFVGQLDPEDQLLLNIADDVEGNILAVEFETTDLDPDAATETVNYGMAFYLLPPDVELPEGVYEGTETDLIEQLGLERIGEIDLGALSLSLDETGEGQDTVIEDTRQTGLPELLSNREIATLDAIFGAA